MADINPIWGQISSGASGFGGLAVAGGQIATSIFQNQIFQAQAKMAIQSAEHAQAMANLNATNTMIAAKEGAALMMSQGGEVRSEQRSAYAAQGVKVGTGAARAIQESTFHRTQMDAINSIAAARNQALGYKMAGTRAMEEGRVASNYYSGQGTQSLIGGIAGSFETLSTGSGKLASFAQSFGAPPKKG